jgi:hypothetical protein
MHDKPSQVYTVTAAMSQLLMPRRASPCQVQYDDCMLWAMALSAAEARQALSCKPTAAASTVTATGDVAAAAAPGLPDAADIWPCLHLKRSGRSAASPPLRASQQPQHHHPGHSGSCGTARACGRYCPAAPGQHRNGCHIDAAGSTTLKTFFKPAHHPCCSCSCTAVHSTGAVLRLLHTWEHVPSQTACPKAKHPSSQLTRAPAAAPRWPSRCHSCAGGPTRPPQA